MPASFLLVAGELSGVERDMIGSTGAELVPVVPERAQRWARPALGLHVWVWSTCAEGARGAWSWSEARGDEEIFACLDGWFVEDAPLSMSLAEAFAGALMGDFGAASAALEGGWSGLCVEPGGRACAGADAAGMQSCYVGERGGLVAVSNRSMLVAMALERGRWPEPDPRFFGWWMTPSMAPLTRATPWPGVYPIEPNRWVQIQGGRLGWRERPAARPYRSWYEARAAHIRRASAWARLPGVSTRLTLTGGKDSRAVLAGILAAGVEDRLDHAYIRAPEQHPDVEIARQLCERVGLEIEVAGLGEFLEQPLLEQVRTHLFRTEGWMHSWDLKAPRTVAPRGVLGGHFGELYRSHFRSYQLGGWPMVYRVMAHPSRVDQHGVLGPELVASLASQMRQWVGRQRAAGVGSHEIHDRWHREARMWQWASDALRADGIGGGLMAPLGSARQLAMYDEQVLLEKRAERTHFELMRAVPDWLWRHPFANASWRLELLPWMGQRPVPGLKRSVWGGNSRHVMLWERHGAQAREYLLDPGADAFGELFERAAVERMLEGYEETGDGFLLKGIYGLLGVRVACREGIASRQARLA